MSETAKTREVAPPIACILFCRTFHILGCQVRFLSKLNILHSNSMAWNTVKVMSQTLTLTSTNSNSAKKSVHYFPCRLVTTEALITRGEGLSKLNKDQLMHYCTFCNIGIRSGGMPDLNFCGRGEDGEFLHIETAPDYLLVRLLELKVTKSIARVFLKNLATRPSLCS